MALNITAVEQNFVNAILQNSVQEYLLAAGVFIGVLLVLKLFKVVIIHRLEKLSKKTKNIYDDVVIAFLKAIGWPFLFFVALYVGLQLLTVSEFLGTVLDYMLLIFGVFYATKGVTAGIDIVAEKEVKDKEEGEPGQASLVITLSSIIKIIVWFIAGLLVLSNLGINVTSLIAGLGVGGIAIAFALQKILEDIFSSFSIYFDKPFEEGDFIIIGDDDLGTVEHIGLKTTRIKHLQGEELVVSNRELTSTRIHNYKKMDRRRVTFSFGVTYDTPHKKLTKIPKIIEKIMSDIEKVELDRAHFKKFGDSALIYEVVYYVDTRDYNIYMDIQQHVNLDLVKEFKKEKIEFAFPTQTIFLNK